MCRRKHLLNPPHAALGVRASTRHPRDEAAFVCVVQTHPSLPGLIPVHCWDQPAAPPTPGASPASSTMGISLPPGLFCAPGSIWGVGACLKDGALQETLGFCAGRHTQCKDAAGSSRDALNRAPGSRSRLRCGLFHPGLAESPPAALSIPKPCSAGCQGSQLWGWATPPSSPGSRIPRLSHGTGPITFIHPVLSQAREGYPGTATTPAFSFWAPLGLGTAETRSRGVGITTGQK